MLPTLIGTINLAIGLWWLWLIVIGPIFFLFRSVPLKLMAGVLVTVGTMYLALTPLAGLQIALPVYVTSSSPQLGSQGFPVADTIEWNLLPGFYDAANQFFIPLLKQYWYIWIPSWLLTLALEAFIPKPRRVEI